MPAGRDPAEVAVDDADRPRPVAPYQPEQIALAYRREPDGVEHRRRLGGGQGRPKKHEQLMCALLARDDPDVVRGVA